MRPLPSAPLPTPAWLTEALPDPWARRARRLAYDNPWLALHEDQVTRPDGQLGLYGVVHFKNHAMAVVPVDEEGCTYLVGQHRYALGATSWEVPEGGCPLGQAPLEAAQRELAEETGWRARHWRYLGAHHLSNSVTDEVGASYLATGLIAGPPAPEGTEALHLRRVPLAHAVAWAWSGLLTDAVSVIALTRAWWALQAPEAQFAPLGPFRPLPAEPHL